eukprot:542893-Rhodomonas_salina.1
MRGWVLQRLWSKQSCARGAAVETQPKPKQVCRRPHAAGQHARQHGTAAPSSTEQARRARTETPPRL